MRVQFPQSPEGRHEVVGHGRSMVREGKNGFRYCVLPHLRN